MTASPKAQAVFGAIDAVRDNPFTESFELLRTKLTALIGDRCFDDLRNLAVESGGTHQSIGEGHTNDTEFLSWLDTLFRGSKIRATVLLAYAVYVSADSPNMVLAALYHLYLTDMDTTPPVNLGTYAAAMGSWHKVPDLKRYADGITADLITPDVDSKRAHGRRIYLAFPRVPDIGPDAGGQYTPNKHWTDKCKPPPRPPPPPKPEPGSEPSKPGPEPTREPGPEPTRESGADQTWLLILLIVIVVVGGTANRGRCIRQ